MTRSLHEQLAAARRRLGMSQVDLARRIGSSQPAISMYESGKQGALALDKIHAAATELGVNLGDSLIPEPEPVIEPTAVRTTFKYCPTPHCPAHYPVPIGPHQVRVVPYRVPADHHDDCCVFCGEILIAECPRVECGVDVTGESSCPKCGEPYVTLDVPEEPVALARWVADKRRALDELQRWHQWMDNAAPAPAAEPAPAPQQAPVA